MELDATTRRRWIGGLALAGAVAMLICGETLLSGRMAASLFVLYWLVCFILTGVAMIAAVRDLRSLVDRTRREQRDLLEDTLKDIQREARDRRRQLRRN